MALNETRSLSECISRSNCVLVEWEFKNINQTFQNLIDIASNLPRTVVIEERDHYWHGVVRSFVFRFPDDLELLKDQKKGVIQVRSSSRFGASDLGVNQKRVKRLYAELLDLKST